jgi:hypothetical protein
VIAIDNDSKIAGIHSIFLVLFIVLFIVLDLVRDLSTHRAIGLQPHGTQLGA